MNSTVNLLDLVALTEDLPEHDLLGGQVGTVVEFLTSGVYEVEFSDDAGRAYATAAVRENQLILLRIRPVKAA